MKQLTSDQANLAGDSQSLRNQVLGQIRLAMGTSNRDETTEVRVTDVNPNRPEET